MRMHEIKYLTNLIENQNLVLNDIEKISMEKIIRNNKVVYDVKIYEENKPIQHYYMDVFGNRKNLFRKGILK
jgi:hypothetical protein